MNTKQFLAWTKKNWLLLVFSLIVAIAGFFRLYQLGAYPPALHADEIMNAYVGRFILENGVDLYGNSWPLIYFDNFGDYPNVIPMYFSGLFTWLLGTNAFALRLPIALMGTTALIPLYLIDRQIFKDSKAPLLMMFLVALQPWQVIMSRATAEGVTATAVLMWALWLLIGALKKNKVWRLALSTVLLALTYFLYPGFRVLVPILLLPTFLLAKNIKWKVATAIISLTFLATTLWMSQQYWVQGRFQQTSTFSQQTEAYVYQQNFITNLGPNQPLLARALYNKPIMYTRQLLTNYLEYWSGSFLFSEGGLPMRYFVPDQGMLLYSWLLVLVFFLPADYLKKVGWQTNNIRSPFKAEGRAYYYWLLYGLVVSPLPAALTIDDVPNVHRAIVMSVLLTLPLGYLFARTKKWRWGRVPIWPVILMLLTVEFGYFWHKYLLQAPAYQAHARQEDIHHSTKELVKLHDQYEQVWTFSGAANTLYYLFLTDDFSPAYASQFEKKLYIPQVDNVNFYEGDCPSTDIIAKATTNDLIIANEVCGSTDFKGFKGTEKKNFMWWQRQATSETGQ